MDKEAIMMRMIRCEAAGIARELRHKQTNTNILHIVHSYISNMRRFYGIN